MLGFAAFSVLALSATLALAADPAPQRYIVVLDAAIPQDSVEPLSREILTVARRTIRSLALRPDAVYRHALKGFTVRIDGASDASRIDALRSDPRVAFVTEDLPLELHTQMFQPNMERLRVRRNGLAAINGGGGAGIDVDIAMLDTGIDATHPDLNVFRSISFIPADPTTIDPHGHGTHVAGIAAAIDDADGVFGVAPGARLWAIKVIGASGVGNLSDVLAGLDYVVTHASEIDVINMSFGGTAIADDGNCGATVGDPLHQAICAVVDAGVVVVVSAGNSSPFGRDASLVRPASYDEVITVSAVVETDGAGPGAGQGAGTIHGPDNSFARTFSNYGWDVDIAAPGVNVISTWPGGGYAAQTGTSIAAPHVAGAAALWIARHGKPSNRAQALHVRDELVRLGFPQFGADVGYWGDRETYAEPLLNVGAIDPDEFDPVEPQLIPDRSIYVCEQDLAAIVTADVKNEQGLPLVGLTSNGFTAYLGGVQKEVQFQELGEGRYSLTLDIEGLLPGDYDFTAVIRNVAGFTRSAGCRIVIRDTEPRLRLHGLAFYWPVMNQDFFYTSNPLHAGLMDEKGAPVAVASQNFQTAFSGGGPALVWTAPDPDYTTGVFPGITYGAYQTQVNGIDTLPLGTYHADVTVNAGVRSGAASASFDVAYLEPALSARLTSNLSTFDFTQPIAPPVLDLTLDVRSEWQTGVAGLTYFVAEPFALRIDGETVAGPQVTEDFISLGIYSIQGVAIGNLAHGSHQLVIRVTDSRGLSVDSNPVTIEVLRETGPCANPLAAPGQPDADNDGIRDACDNCPTVSNRSQRDSSPENPDESGLGDACSSHASVKVSSAAGDNPDFFTIQQAIDHATASPSGVRIEVFSGLGPYLENVTVDRDQPFSIVGRNEGSGRPVVQSVVPGEAVFDLRSAGAGTIGIQDLVLRGTGAAANQKGILVETPLSGEFSRLRFEQLGTGVDLRAGGHLMTRIEMDGTVATGVRVDDAAMTLRYGELRGVSEGVRISGPSVSAGIEHLLLVGNGSGDGIVNGSSRPASLDLRHSTLVNCGTAVRGNGTNTRIAHSILWGNVSDRFAVPCADVSWSNVQTGGCGGTNRSVDPSFVNAAAGDYHLRATSPLLEHGPDPALYTGFPCVDLDGGPRLRDHDGDRLARVDPGAYERRNASMRPEVTGLVWSGPTTLGWNSEPSATEYHVYRAPLTSLAWSAFGVCADGLDAVRSDTILTDTAVPPAGDGFYYQVTAENASGMESTLGVGTCAERSNFASCP